MRMRCNYFIPLMGWCALFLLPVRLSAHVITSDKHKPFTTDSLWVYKLPYIQVTDTGRNCVWDFSELSTDTADVIDMNYYRIIEDDSAQYGLHQEHAHYYYQYVRDTLWQTGYETSRTHMHYPSPIPVLRFPMAYGDSLCGVYSGQGRYCHMRSIFIDGYYSVHADAVGQLVLPEVTIDSVLRVHSVFRFKEMKRTKSYVQEERYAWYSPYCRYPLIETVLMHTYTAKDTVSAATAYYYPQEQKDMPAHETIQEEEPQSPQDSLITDVRYVPNPVYSDLHIYYSLVRPAQVYISVHYNGGTTTYQSPLHFEEDGEHTLFVNMAGMPVGSYTIYIYADNTVVSGNIIKL